MHLLAVVEMVKSVRRRMLQGDCPIEAPFGREQLEDALVTLAQLYERSVGPLEGLLEAPQEAARETTGGPIELHLRHHPVRALQAAAHFLRSTSPLHLPKLLKLLYLADAEQLGSAGTLIAGYSFLSVTPSWEPYIVLRHSPAGATYAALQIDPGADCLTAFDLEHLDRVQRIHGQRNLSDMVEASAEAILRQHGYDDQAIRALGQRNRHARLDEG